MSCVNFTRRSRCNSSSRCCYRASGHVDPACSRDNPLVKHSGAYITLPSLRYVNVRRHVTRAYVQTMTGTRKFSWRRTRGGGYLDEKGCTSCEDGTYVFQDASTVAGVYYAADPSSCRSCPDEHMSFGSGGYCSCDNG